MKPHLCYCKQPASIYCHRKTEWFCESCAKSEFPKCEGCTALDIEDDFEQDSNGCYYCPACIRDADKWERTKDFLEYCLRNNIV